VKLLIHGSSRPFVDASDSKNAVVNQYALVTVSGGKITQPANTGAFLCVPTSNASWKFGVSSWFISGWVSGTYTTLGTRLFDTRPVAGSASGWSMSVQASTRAPFMVIENTTYGVGTPAANLLVPASGGTVSFSYDGTDLRCFVDGALSWTHTVSLNIDTGNELIIGNSGSNGADSNSTQQTKELLIISGESVATSAFTVPSTWTDTGIVLEAWNPATYANVKLNCHMSGTNGGTTFTDTSTGAKTVTANGNVQTSTAQARIGSSSGLFDGTGDYLTLADSADWDFAANFSIEMQIRPSITTRQVLYSNYAGSANGVTLQIDLTTSGRIHLNMSGDGSEIDTGVQSYLPIAQNTWQHIAISRIGTALMLFYEGEAVIWVTDSTSPTAASSLYIGRLTTFSTTIDFNGHMQELRVVKGEGYPRSFVVPTAALPDS
jgi:hypothetical protein